VARRTLNLALQVLLVAVVVNCGGTSVAATHPPSPSPSPTMTVADKAMLAQLEARPLVLPPLLKGGACPPDGLDTATGLYGADPVYAAGGPHSATPFGDYFDVSAITKPGLLGPVLLRGQDLKVPGHPLVFLGPWAVGPVYGTDPTFGAQYTELALDTAHPPTSTYFVKDSNYVQWFWRQGIATGWSGCVGFQFDGPAFSAHFVSNTHP
jgi:hypothetical protein